MLIYLRRQPVMLKRQIQIAAGLVVLLVSLELINSLTGRALNAYGLIPRQGDSLWLLPVAPLLHGNFWHLMSNLPAFLVFTLLLFQHGGRHYWLVTLGVIVIGGLGVWLFGRSAVHLGSSLLVFGYLGYLLLAGLVSGEVKLLLITALVAFLYGSMIWGIFPQQHWISFESHLFGFGAGLFLAVLFGRARH